MGKILLTACVALALLGCGRSTDSDERADHYDTRGVVRGFSPDRSTIEIQHEDIPGFMPSMTMPFVARGPRQIADLKTGDAISFPMAVTKNDFWIENVKKLRREDVNVAEPKQSSPVSADRDARLQEGDKMPPFSLTNQNGERISLDLSVTLDPDYDTPRVLNDYAAFHHADYKIWSFATGDEKEIDSLTRSFSVYRQNEGGTISHELATALINRDGRIQRIWRGNAWTPAEVTDAIQAETK